MAVKVTTRNASTGRLEENAVLEVGAAVTGGDTQGTLPNVSLIDVTTAETLTNPSSITFDSKGRKLVGTSGVPGGATIFSVGQSTGSTIAANKAVGPTTTSGKVQLALPFTGAAAIGFTIASIVNNGTGYIQTSGLLAGFSGLTPGADYYLSPGGSGDITTTMPFSDSDGVQKVGVAITATTLDITISPFVTIRLNPPDADYINLLGLDFYNNLTEYSMNILPPSEYRYVTNSTGVQIAGSKAIAVAGADSIKLADSSTSNDFPVIGFTPSLINNSSSGKIQVAGILPFFSGLTTGAVYFSNPASPGGITATPPTTVGQKSQIVGRALSTTVLIIEIQEPITLTGATSTTTGITLANDSGAIVKQAAYPGTQQTGANVNIDGAVNAAAGLLVNGNYVNPVAKNWLINANFDIWQRGTTTTVGSVGRFYIADRWSSIVNGTSPSVTVSRQAFTVGQTAVPYEPLYFIRQNLTTVSTNTSNVLDQIIEDVRTLAGQTVTVSFYAKADASRSMTATYIQLFGTGGSTTVVTSVGGTYNLTTSWQKFTATLNIPGISGLTIGTADTHYCVLRFVLPSGVINYVDIAQVQLETGSNASPYQMKTLAEELNICKRYYQKSFPYATAPVQNVGSVSGAYRLIVGLAGASSGNYGTSMRFPISLRVSPTMVLFNPSAANAQARNALRSTDGTSTAVSGLVSPDQFTVNTTGVTGWTVGDPVDVHWTAEADY